MALSASTSPGMIRGGSRPSITPDSNTTGLPAPTLNGIPAFSSGGLSTSTTYYWKITAINGSSESLPSNERSSSGSSAYQIAFSEVTGATGYKLYRGTAAGAESTLVATIPSGVPALNVCWDGGSTSTSATPPASDTSGGLSAPSVSTIQAKDGGAFSAGTYYYKVTATSASGETLPSDEVSVAAGDSQYVELVWSTVSGSTGYKIYRGTSAGGESELIGVTSHDYATGFVDCGGVGTAATPPNTSGLSAPVQSDTTPSDSGGNMATGTYYYEITATDANGETTASNEKSGTITTGASGSVALSWGEVSGATGYKIYRGTSSGAENVLITTITDGATTTYTDTKAASPVAAGGETVEFDWSGKDGNTLAVATMGKLSDAVDVVVTDQTGKPFTQLGDYADSWGSYVRLSLWRVPATATVIRLTRYTIVPTCLIIFDSDTSYSVTTAGAGGNYPPSIDGKQTLMAFYTTDPIAWPPAGSIVSPDYAPGAGFSTVQCGAVYCTPDPVGELHFMLYLDQGDGTNAPTFNSLPQWWAAIGLS